MTRVRRVVGQKAQVQTQEPLVKLVHVCEIHYAKEVPNPPLSTQLVMTTDTLNAEAIVPASVAIELAKELADEIGRESYEPCTSYDCTNTRCKGWISTLNELKKKYKNLQDKEPDYSVHLDTIDWVNSIIDWALEYTKYNGMIDDYAEIASHVFDDVDYNVFEELLEVGYSPEEIFKAFSKYLDEDDILMQFCHLKDQSKEVAEFLKKMNFNCDEE